MFFKSAQKREQEALEAARTTCDDVQRYLTEIQRINRKYTDLVTRLEQTKAPKRQEALEALATERNTLKDEFIAKKQACRSLISLIAPGENPSSALADLRDDKDSALKRLQEDFRDIDKEYKDLGMKSRRTSLMSTRDPHDSPASPHMSIRILAGGAGRAGGKGEDDDANDLLVSPPGPTNDEYITGAVELTQKATTQLHDGLRTIAETKETAAATAQMLVADREKMVRASKALDEVQAELEVSRKMLIRIVKRFYTDKVLIALTFLVVCAIVGIIVFATMNPETKVFNVPDEIKPPAVNLPTAGSAVFKL